MVLLGDRLLHDPAWEVTGAIAEFGLADLLDVEVPDLKTLETTTFHCLEAMSGARGLSWEPMKAGCHRRD